MSLAKWIAIFGLLNVTACKAREPESSDVFAMQGDGNALLNQIYDDGTPSNFNGAGPSDILSTPSRIAWELTKGCGFNAGKIKPFRTDFLQSGGKKPFFEENSWRKIARPGAKGQCAAKW